MVHPTRSIYDKDDAKFCSGACFIVRCAAVHVQDSTKIINKIDMRFQSLVLDQDCVDIGNCGTKLGYTEFFRDSGSAASVDQGTCWFAHTSPTTFRRRPTKHPSMSRVCTVGATMLYCCCCSTHSIRSW